ncbi:hypothetical protein K525DRAFT_273139 [Schizophyllum commune Loenen D]|nr:hypothetical protein K525DRAFT_273139 [Schizophyllum commune Loenen D]
MTEVELAQELKDAIIDELYWKRDFRSLASCALAHNSFRTTSQKYLFRHIRLGSGPSARCFHARLQKHGALAEHVESLLFDEGPCFDEEYYEHHEAEWTSYLWIRKERAVLADILDLLPTVRTLFIQSWDDSCAVGVNDAPLLDALERATRRCLYTLGWYGSGGIHDQILGDERCQVRDLRMIQTRAGFYSRDRTPKAPLKSLVLSGIHYVPAEVPRRYVSHLSQGHPLDVRGLEILRVDSRVVRKERHDIVIILRQCQSTLRSLDIYGPDLVGNIWLDLNRLEQLRLLSIRGSSKDRYAWNIIIDDVTRILSTAVCVEHLAIEIYLSSPLDDAEDRWWNELSRALTNCRLGRTLKTVTLHLRRPKKHWVNKVAPELPDAAFIRGKMPALASRVELNVERSPVRDPFSRSLVPLELLEDGQ